MTHSANKQTNSDVCVQTLSWSKPGNNRTETQTLQCLQTLSSGDVPHFNRGVGIARHENVVTQFHAASQRLMTNQRV